MSSDRSTIRVVASGRFGQLDGHLFGRRGGGALSVVGLQHMIQRVVAQSSLSVRCSPHVLRQTFARAFLANGGDVFTSLVVPIIRGHATFDVILSPIHD